MGRDFLPRSSAQLQRWTKNFAAGLALDPGACGVTIQEAEDYAAVQSRFAEALQVAHNFETRGRLSVYLKDELRKTLEAETRTTSLRRHHRL